MSIKILSVFLLFLIISGCKTPSVTEKPNDGGSIRNNGNAPALNINAGNGITNPPNNFAQNATYDLSMVGGLITYATDTQTISTCSGTWLCPNVFMTADHCLSIPNSNKYSYYTTSLNSFSTSIVPLRLGLGKSYFSSSVYTSAVTYTTVTDKKQDLVFMITDNYAPAATSFVRLSKMVATDVNTITTTLTPDAANSVIVGYGRDTTPTNNAGVASTPQTYPRQWGYNYPTNTLQGNPFTFQGGQPYNGPTINTAPLPQGSTTNKNYGQQYFNIGDEGGPLFWPTANGLEQYGVASTGDPGKTNNSQYVPIYQIAPAILDAKQSVCRGPMTASPALTCTASLSGNTVNFVFSDKTNPAGTKRTYQALLASNQVISLGTGTNFNYQAQGQTNQSIPLPASLVGQSSIWLTIVMNISDINDQKVWTQCQVQPATVSSGNG